MNYNKIYNPITKKYVDVQSDIGYKLIKKYNQLKGGKPKPVLDPEALLDAAADEDNVDEIYKLLDLGIDIDIQSEYGDTALHYAISNNCLENAIALINEGANLNIMNNDGFTPFTLICESFLKGKLNDKEQEGIDIMKYMLQQEKLHSQYLNVNSTIGGSRDTDSALILLVKFAKDNSSISYQLINLLLIHKKPYLDINYQNKDGENALDISITLTHGDEPSEISKLLYENGAISNQFDTSTFNESEDNESEDIDEKVADIPICGMNKLTTNVCYDGAERLYGSEDIPISDQLENHGLSSGNINQVYQVEYLVNLLSKYLINMNNHMLQEPRSGPNLVAIDNDHMIISEPIMFQNPYHRPFKGSADLCNTYISFSLINQLVPLDMKEELNDDEAGWKGNNTKFLNSDSANWYKLQDQLRVNDVLLDTNAGDITQDNKMAFLVVEIGIDGQFSLLGFRIQENKGNILDEEGKAIHPITQERVRLIRHHP